MGGRGLRNTFCEFRRYPPVKPAIGSLTPQPPELGEVHMALMARRRLRPTHQLLWRTRSVLAHVAVHFAVAARIPRRPNCLEQPHCAELAVLRQTRVDDPLAGIEFREPPTPRPILDIPLVQLLVQSPRREPAAQRPLADAARSRLCSFLVLSCAVATTASLS